MKIRDIYTSKAVALRQTEVASNKQAYLGEILFPSKKKMGLDLKWIKTHKGLPVSLAPTAFDAKSTLRSREGFKMEKTQMAFFRESMLISEEDEQEIMRVQDSADPYAQAVIDHIYGDAQTLVEGALVVPERMRMQLLAPENGSPKIYIEANGTRYEYNYDPNGTFASNNFVQNLGSASWLDGTNSDPLEDARVAMDAVEELTGERPTLGILTKATMNLLIKNAKIRSAILAQNVSANIFVNENRVKALFLEELGLNLVVYTKKYKDENGVARQFFPDGYLTLCPNSELGNTFYGTTPEERSLMGDANADVAIVNTGVAVTVTTTSDPVNTKTTVSEIVLPSFEGMDSVYVIKAYTELGKVVGTVAEGSSSGNTKVTITGSGTFKVDTTSTTLPLYGSDASALTSYTSGSDITIADGKQFIIVSVNADGLVIGGAVFTADTKA